MTGLEWVWDFCKCVVLPLFSQDRAQENKKIEIENKGIGDNNSQVGE